MTRAVRSALAAALAASLAASCGPGPPPMQGNRFDLGGPRERFDEAILRANPSKVIAAELAFARAAQDKGQWTAFAEYATDDAVMFVPEAVNAQAWLKGRANPPQAVRWQPHQVWSSCDGSLAVTKGAWQRPDGSVGYFTTVWERQENGEYKWVLDQGDVLAEPLEAPEMIDAKSANCGSNDSSDAWDSEEADWEANSEAAGAVIGLGESDDRTLAYRYVVRPSGARETTVFMRTTETMQEVLRSTVAAE
jgi:hypothetical protein